MFLAEKTVKNYVSNLLTKLGHAAAAPRPRSTPPGWPTGAATTIPVAGEMDDNSHDRGSDRGDHDLQKRPHRRRPEVVT